MSDAIDESMMAHALRLAAKGRFTSFPNPRVGCVIVRQGNIVAEGWHEKAGEAHAEIHALNLAGADARDSDIYVTLEPCCHQGRTGPCVEALISTGPKRVIAAMPDPNPQVSGQGFARLKDAGIEVIVGLMQKQAEQLNRGFVSRMSRQRPFVTLKMAASLDGRTAMADGESQWITGRAARADGHRLRAEAGAVLCSSATVLADNPSMTVRDWPCTRQPDRIVLDARGRVGSGAKIWNDDGARCFSISSSESALPTHVTQLATKCAPDGRLNLEAALKALSVQEVNSVLVECGPGLAGGLLGAGLIDEVVLYLSADFLGDQARGLASIPALEKLSDRVRMKFSDVRRVANDLRITAIPEPVATDNISH